MEFKLDFQDNFELIDKLEDMDMKFYEDKTSTICQLKLQIAEFV
jgi:hypothetical protein